LTQQMQQSLARDITTTPAEVRKFFNRIKDSIPLIPAKVQISIIQIDPPDNEENKLEVRQKLLNLRRRIIEGESFRALAILYSEDDGSATHGGEIGFLPRSNLDNAYADEAFSLKKNSVSRIVESEFGFHIIELIDRNGDMINTRHILMKTKVKPGQVAEAINKLDSIADFVRKDSLSFELAALRYSTDKDSRLNGGKFVTNDSRENLIEIDNLHPDTYRVVRDLKIGEISNAFQTEDSRGNTVFRTVRLDSRTEPHNANLKIDFNYIQELSLATKRSDVYRKWIFEKMEVTYIKISDEFRTCQFINNGWLK
ncbi:MAG: peptidylprolyl isomerase, partial [Bacteroidales bacterium]|nr:peptidylprolyl isomerase [Bacteroidales bacterium]